MPEALKRETVAAIKSNTVEAMTRAAKDWLGITTAGDAFGNVVDNVTDWLYGSGDGHDPARN